MPMLQSAQWVLDSRITPKPPRIFKICIALALRGRFLFLRKNKRVNKIKNVLQFIDRTALTIRSPTAQPL